METFLTYASLSTLCFFAIAACTIGFSLFAGSPNSAGYLEPTFSNSKIKTCSVISFSLMFIWTYYKLRFYENKTCDVMLTISVTHLAIALLLSKSTMGDGKNKDKKLE